MKKIKQLVFTLCTVALMIAGMTIVGYADSGTYMFLKSDDGYIDNLIRISNAVGMDDKMHIATKNFFGRLYKYDCYAYFCDSPVEVKALDDVDDFIIYKLSKNSGTLSLDNSNLNDNEWFIGNAISYNSNEKIVGGKTKLGGVTAKLTTGAYLVSAIKDNDLIIAAIIVSDTDNTYANKAVTAAPTTSKVLVNGNNTAFDAYIIKGSNYFKLRDIAYALSGSAKQFDVAWDGINDAIKLTSNKSYTATGGEMDRKKTGTKPAMPSTAKILLDGTRITLTAYNIGDNNYFKLRDIGQALDFEVEWDDKNNTIIINTELEGF